MAVSDEELGNALRTLLKLDIGFYIEYGMMLQIGQFENRNYWVESRDENGSLLWEKEDIPLEEAITHFLRIRRERLLGYDIESDRLFSSLAASKRDDAPEQTQ